MKIQGEKYDKMYKAVQAVVEHFGFDAIQARLANASLTALVWQVWNRASFDLLNNDDHPSFQGDGPRARLVPYDPQFNLQGIDDNHIETALKRIFRETGII